jgi:hypothetical protein
MRLLKKAKQVFAPSDDHRRIRLLSHLAQVHARD